MNKKGVIRDVVLGVIVAVLCIALLLTAASKFLGLFGKNDSQEAKSTLEEFAASLNEANATNELVSFVALTPKNWFLISFSEGEGPDDCWGGKCICICSTDDCKKEKTCVNVDKKVLQNGISISIKIPSDIFITSGENYEISTSSLTAWQPSTTDLDSWFGNKYPALFGLGQCILNNSKIKGVPVDVILAVAIHESAGGTSKRAQPTCVTDTSKYSNNLFGITDIAGPGPAGVCPSIGTKECLTESEKEQFGATEVCDLTCGEKSCYWIGRGFRAYYNKCQSVEDFTNIISTKYLTAMQYKDNSELMIEEIGKSYANDPAWADQVITIAESIKSSVGIATA